MKTRRKINDSLTYFSNNMTDQCINRSKIQPQNQHSVLYTRRSPSQRSFKLSQENREYFFKTENDKNNHLNLKLFLKTPKNRPKIKHIEQLKCHNHAINSLQFKKINNGSVVIFTASHDYSIKAHVFDTQDHSLETVRSVRKAHSRYVTALNQVQDTQILVSGGADSALKFWEFDNEDFNLQYKFGKHAYHGGQINRVGSWGTKIFTSSTDRTLKVMDLISTNCVRTIQFGKAVDFSIINKNQFMVSDQKNLKLFDLRLGKYQSRGCLKFEDSNEICQFTSLDDENMYLVANINAELQLIDIRKMLHIQKIKVEGNITALHAGSSGRASIAYEGVLKVFNIKDFQEYGKYHNKNNVVDILEYQDYLFLASKSQLDILKIDYF